ncbi:MAG: dihydrolipoyl dehydrogenase [Leptospira sp.]|nr:dihydrolipoyl dehydrogenase [Leptospira sp.]
MAEEKSKKKYDVVVLGGGPGGYVAAIRASQLGLSVAVVEKDKMGGVCLNWGCIPTKALLQSAHLYSEVQDSKKFGLEFSSKAVDFSKIVDHSRKVADQMASGVDFLMKKNKVEIFQGSGFLKDKNTISIRDNAGKEKDSIQGKYIIIATGARPRPLPFLPFDQKLVLSSKEAMIQKEIPKTLAIIGAGAIGVEFADIYSSLGSKVTIIEALPHLLPNEDEEVSKALERSFKKRKLDFYTNTKLSSAKVEKSIKLELEISESSSSDKKSKTKKESLTVDKVIVGIGIQPNTENVGIDELGIKSSKGFIDINKRNYRTTVDTIYAIGDCIQTPWLAHVASSEGIRAAEDISIREGNPHSIHTDILNYSAIPGCTYCHPEVASVGMTEKKAIAEGYEFTIGKIPFSANGKAQAMGDAEGFVKILADKKSKAILGAHIIGPNATELINEYVLAIKSELTVEDVGRTTHAHPTLSETLMEAAEAAMGHAIHV